MLHVGMVKMASECHNNGWLSPDKGWFLCECWFGDSNLPEIYPQPHSGSINLFGDCTTDNLAEVRCAAILTAVRVKAFFWTIARILGIQWVIR